jgi:UDPglucose 6-dehydrogenase
MANARSEIDGVEWCDDAYSAMAEADALVILTEWNAFRALDLERVKQLMAAPVMIDLRNVYDPESMAKAGFRYVCVGRGTAPKGPAAER